MRSGAEEAGQQKKAGMAEKHVLSCDEVTENIKNKDRKVMENLTNRIIEQRLNYWKMKSHENHKGKASAPGNISDS